MTQKMSLLNNSEAVGLHIFADTSSDCVIVEPGQSHEKFESLTIKLMKITQDTKFRNFANENNGVDAGLIKQFVRSAELSWAAFVSDIGVRLDGRFCSVRKRQCNHSHTLRASC